jgi:hypothetical protein
LLATVAEKFSSFARNYTIGALTQTVSTAIDDFAEGVFNADLVISVTRRGPALQLANSGRIGLRNTFAAFGDDIGSGAAREIVDEGYKITAIGRMKDLEQFADNPLVDTWAKSGRMGGADIKWPENRAWLDERIARGDEFWLATDPSTLPPRVGGYQAGVPNGYFTAKELHHLLDNGIKPKWVWNWLGKP